MKTARCQARERRAKNKAKRKRYDLYLSRHRKRVWTSREVNRKLREPWFLNMLRELGISRKQWARKLKAWAEHQDEMTR